MSSERCPECGALIPEGEETCPKCGAHKRRVPVPPMYARGEAEQTRPPKPGYNREGQRVTKHIAKGTPVKSLLIATGLSVALMSFVYFLPGAFVIAMISDAKSKQQAPTAVAQKQAPRQGAQTQQNPQNAASNSASNPQGLQQNVDKGKGIVAGPLESPKNSGSSAGQKIEGVQKIEHMSEPFAILPNEQGLVPVVKKLTQTYKDANGNAIGVPDAYEVTYTADYKPVEIKRNGETYKKYSYNDKGQLTSVSDGFGGSAQYTYDDKGRMASITWSGYPGDNDNPTKFVYDDNSRLTSAGFNKYKYANDFEYPTSYEWTNWSIKVDTKFDELGRVLAAPLSAQDIGVNYSFEYGPGTSVKAQLMDAPPEYQFGINVETDDSGRLVQISDKSGTYLKNISYDEYGNITEATGISVEIPDETYTISAEYEMAPIDNVYKGYVPAIDLIVHSIGALHPQLWEGPYPKIYELVNTASRDATWSDTWSRAVLQRK